jgi:hypothetical protein
LEEIVSILLDRLSQKGLAPKEIPSLIRDILHIISDGGEFTVGEINQKLTNRGWREQIMDQSTFELIVCLLEHECGFEVETYTLH